MPHQPRRAIGHVRRHGIAYVALVVAFSFSPVPSIAADLVTTADLANGAVTQPKLAADSVVSGKIANETIASGDIKNGTVGTADLSAGARGAKVIRYDLGSFDFGLDGTLQATLPGSWDAATVAESTWSAVMVRDYGGGAEYAWAAPGFADGSEYGFYISSWGPIVIYRVSGPGEDYENIYLYRTASTSTQVVP